MFKTETLNAFLATIVEAAPEGATPSTKAAFEWLNTVLLKEEDEWLHIGCTGAWVTAPAAGRYRFDEATKGEGVCIPAPLIREARAAGQKIASLNFDASTTYVTFGNGVCISMPSFAITVPAWRFVPLRPEAITFSDAPEFVVDAIGYDMAHVMRLPDGVLPISGYADDEIAYILASDGILYVQKVVA